MQIVAKSKTIEVDGRRIQDSEPEPTNPEPFIAAS